MKKLLVLTLALALTLAMVGCVASQSNVPPVSETQVETQAVTEAVIEETQPETQVETQKKEEQITEEEAKSIALKHASLKESEVSHMFVELDYDDGVLRYEVDFRKDRVEYDYDIDAKTGEILSYDQDYDD